MGVGGGEGSGNIRYRERVVLDRKRVETEQALVTDKVDKLDLDRAKVL